MANYYGVFKSNHFRVKDVEKFKELMKGALAEDIECLIEGNVCCVYGSHTLDYEVFNFCKNCKECDTPTEISRNFCEKLSEIIAEDDAAIFMEVGHETFRYLASDSVIVTSNAVEYINLENESIEKARELLNNCDWTV